MNVKKTDEDKAELRRIADDLWALAKERYRGIGGSEPTVEKLKSISTKLHGIASKLSKEGEPGHEK